MLCEQAHDGFVLAPLVAVKGKPKAEVKTEAKAKPGAKLEKKAEAKPEEKPESKLEVKSEAGVAKEAVPAAETEDKKEA